jgi:hypothetical protein
MCLVSTSTFFSSCTSALLVLSCFSTTRRTPARCELALFSTKVFGPTSTQHWYLRKERISSSIFLVRFGVLLVLLSAVASAVFAVTIFKSFDFRDCRYNSASHRSQVFFYSVIVSVCAQAQNQLSDFRYLCRKWRNIFYIFTQGYRRPDDKGHVSVNMMIFSRISSGRR